MTGGVLAGLLLFGAVGQAQATHTVVVSVQIGNVDAQVSGIAETLSVVSKNVSDNTVFPGNKVTFPAGNGVVSSPQYLEVSFQSNALGSAVILSTDNRRVTTDNRGPAANPAFKSGVDGIIGTADDEIFAPSTGVSGAGLVGLDPKGHGFTVPLLWAVYDNPVAGGYAFTGNLGATPNTFAEAVVTDKAQTYVFSDKDDNGNTVPVRLVAQLFDSPKSLAYASIAVGLTKVNTDSVGLIASFPEDIDGPANGLLNGLRKATSPIALYLGVDYRGATAQLYRTSTLTLELIHQ